MKKIGLAGYSVRKTWTSLFQKGAFPETMTLSQEKLQPAQIKLRVSNRETGELEI